MCGWYITPAWSVILFRFIALKDWRTPSFLPKRAGEGKWKEQQGNAAKSLP